MILEPAGEEPCGLVVEHETAGLEPGLQAADFQYQFAMLPLVIFESHPVLAGHQLFFGVEMDRRVGDELIDDAPELVSGAASLDTAEELIQIPHELAMLTVDDRYAGLIFGSP